MAQLLRLAVVVLAAGVSRASLRAKPSDARSRARRARRHASHAALARSRAGPPPRSPRRARAVAGCPNACRGGGVCGVNDICSCYVGLTGADCSQRVCPYGDSHEFISDVGQALQPVQYGYDSHFGSSDPYVGFLPAVTTGAAQSAHHMHAFLNNGFLLNRDATVYELPPNPQGVAALEPSGQ
jgi:hypothetical protein